MNITEKVNQLTETLTKLEAVKIETDKQIKETKALLKKWAKLKESASNLEDKEFSIGMDKLK